MQHDPRDLSCNDLVELVTDYLEVALPPELRGACEQHLVHCPYCATYLQQVRQTMLALSRLVDETVPASARAQLVARFRAWREQTYLRFLSEFEPF